MMEMKIEYAIAAFVGERDPKAIPADIPVVRLEAVDAVIAEAVKFAEIVVGCYRWTQNYSASAMAKATLASAQAFLASDIVTQWRERQKAGQP